MAKKKAIKKSKKSNKAKQNKSPKKRKKNLFSAPRGIHDVLPGAWPYWQSVISSADNLASFYSFGRIDTPILEKVDLFERGIGEDTDAVEKEMYKLKTKGGSKLALRPENTASVARAFLEHNMGRGGKAERLWYFGKMFRHERPQAGRYRQFSQIGFEIMGGQSDSFYDALIILISLRTLEDLKLKKLLLKVNSIGCKTCRPNYIKQLQTYYKPHLKNMCADCARRFERNPLRLLDCKKEPCVPFKDRSPNILDKLCNACSSHFAGVLEYLDEAEIPYQLDNLLVRGLDYYSRTVFEINIEEGPGSEVGALFGGGRYDYLFESLGAKSYPAVGSAAGVERIVEAMKMQETKISEKKVKKVFLIHVGELAKRKLFAIAEDLRGAGLSIVEGLGKESLKSQLKMADKENARLALILGQKEIFEGSIIIRDLRSGAQEEVSLEKMIPELKKRLRRK